jgi:hypothetical protein
VKSGAFAPANRPFRGAVVPPAIGAQGRQGKRVTQRVTYRATRPERARLHKLNVDDAAPDGGP